MVHGNSVQSEQSILHSSGHLIGYLDRYKKDAAGNAKIDEGYGTDPMGNPMSRRMELSNLRNVDFYGQLFERIEQLEKIGKLDDKVHSETKNVESF
jgi:hypothetical protein